MKRRSRTFAASVTGFAAAGIATAATLVSPMMFPAIGQTVECIAHNVDNDPISTLTVSMVGAANVVIGTTNVRASITLVDITGPRIALAAE